LDENILSREQRLTDLIGLLMQIGRQATLHPMTGLTSPQFIVLTWLQDQGPLPMSDIADRVGITMAGATGLVDRLVHAGWVTRERSAEDRRVVMIHLTPAGQEAVAQDKARRRERLRALTSGLSDADLADLHRILGTVLQATLRGPDGRS
jgi:DNA-binding MarR family transcriptional regulator